MREKNKGIINPETKKLMSQDAPNPVEDSMDNMDESFGEDDMQPSIMNQQQSQQQTEAQQQMPMSQQMGFPSQPVKIDYTPSNIDEIEELVESVVDEKWRSLLENFGDITLWKDKVRTEILSIKQELRRIEARFALDQSILIAMPHI